MKVFNFVSSALVSSVLMVSTAFGNDPGHSVNLKKAESSLRDQIASSLHQVDAYNQAEVYVYFNASPASGFEVKKVSGTDHQLAGEVKDQLKSAHIAVPQCIHGNYLVKVLFRNGIANEVTPEEELRNTISEALSNVKVQEGMVKLYFSVKANKINVQKAEGNDKDLASLVENTLNNTSVNSANDLTGNYRINVKF